MLTAKTSQNNRIDLLRCIRADFSDRTDVPAGAFHPSVSDHCTCAHAALRSVSNAADFNIRNAFDKGQKKPVGSKYRHHLYQLTNMLLLKKERLLWLQTVYRTYPPLGKKDLRINILNESIYSVFRNSQVFTRLCSPV